MHARLVTVLALAALISSTACGQSEHDTTDAQIPASDVAAEPEPPHNGVEPPSAERHDALPASFPQDIKLPAGLIAKSVVSENAGSYVAIFTGDLDPEVVYGFFSEHLLAEGWKIDKALGVGPELGIFASKGGRIATVICTRIDGRLHVELGVSAGS
ncbi:MAG: hypothetical protein WEF50_15685 [Myxococcota bacterium]